MIINYYSHSSSNSLMFYGNQPQVIATPNFDAETYTMQVSFWLRTDNITGANELEVGVMSDAGNINTFVSIESVTPTATGEWQLFTVSLADSPVGNHFVAFRQTTTGNWWYWLDDISIISTAPTPVTVVTEQADNITSNSATLNKTVTEGTHTITAEGFRYKTIDATLWSNLTTSAATGHLSGLAPNTEYMFFAYASTAIDGQVNGDTLTFTTEDGPIVVTNAATLVLQTTATLNKTVTPGTEAITGEGWKYKRVSDTEWIDVTTTSGNLTGLIANTTYEFYAYAVTISNSTFTGTTLTFTTQAHTLPTVTTQAATEVECETATLHKIVVPGTESITEEGFEYRRVGDATWSTDADGYLIGLTERTNYEFRAYATTATGTYYYGDIMTFITQQCLGYDEANANGFLIYPNPASSIVTVNIEGLSTSAKVTVTDINGKLIETRIINAGDSKAELDVANYTDGTYLVRVVSDNINRVEKLIVKK
jgi:hypothetical protein